MRMMKWCGCMFFCVLLAACQQKNDAQKKTPQALVEILHCMESPGTGMRLPNAKLAIVTPGIGIPPHGTVELAFWFEGKEVGRGVGDTQIQYQAVMEHDGDGMDVLLVDVTSDDRLANVDKCTVTDYWDQENRPVTFEERTGIVEGGGVELMRLLQQKQG